MWKGGICFIDSNFSKIMVYDVFISANGFTKYRNSLNSKESVYPMCYSENLGHNIAKKVPFL